MPSSSDEKGNFWWKTLQFSSSSLEGKFQGGYARFPREKSSSLRVHSQTHERKWFDSTAWNVHCQGVRSLSLIDEGFSSANQMKSFHDFDEHFPESPFNISESWHWNLFMWNFLKNFFWESFFFLCELRLRGGWKFKD